MAPFSTIGMYLGKRRKLELKWGNVQARCQVLVSCPERSLPEILKYCVYLSIHVLLSEE